MCTKRGTRAPRCTREETGARRVHQEGGRFLGLRGVDGGECRAVDHHVVTGGNLIEPLRRGDVDLGPVDAHHCLAVTSEHVDKIRTEHPHVPDDQPAHPSSSLPWCRKVACQASRPCRRADGVGRQTKKRATENATAAAATTPQAAAAARPLTTEAVIAAIAGAMAYPYRAGGGT